MRELDVSQPNIHCDVGADQLVLDASVNLQQVPEFANPEQLQLGLSVVLEDGDGNLSYGALLHPSTKPDFHHPDSFTLTLNHSKSYK